MNRSDVENVLLEIGIPAGIKGFRYITDAIMALDDEKSCSKGAIALYTKVAEMNHTTYSRVERAIRHAFEIARSPKGNHEAVEHYIGFMNCSNINSLKMLYTRIKNGRKDKKEEMKETKEESLIIGKDDIRQIVREELKAIMGGIE